MSSSGLKSATFRLVSKFSASSVTNIIVDIYFACAGLGRYWTESSLRNVCSSNYSTARNFQDVSLYDAVCP
jgi:hypothetical protein